VSLHCSNYTCKTSYRFRQFGDSSQRYFRYVTEIYKADGRKEEVTSEDR